MTDVAPQRRWGARGSIAALVLLGLLFTSVYPLRRYFDVRRQVASLHAESRALDTRAESLRQQVATLQTDAEVERQARERLGMVGKGDTAFSMPKVATPEPTPTVVLGSGAAESGAGGGVISRWWDAFRSVWHPFG